MAVVLTGHHYTHRSFLKFSSTKQLYEKVMEIKSHIEVISQGDK